MNVNANNKFIDILVTKSKDLHLYNTFNCESSNDLLYFILYVYEQLKLNPEEIELTIDGQVVTVPADSTILEAANSVGIKIPVLCYFEYTTANGLCRLCAVEVEGTPGMQMACVTQVQADSIVHTRSNAIDRGRRTILEMLASTVDLSETPEVLDMLEEYDAQPERFSGGKTLKPQLIDDNPLFIRDYAKCVMCWRCVQVCAEDAQYAFAINFGGRGFETTIATFFDKPIPATTCSA